MFFVFYILVLINYVSYTSNYVLQRITQNFGTEPSSNDQLAIFQDVHNNTFETQTTTLKSLFEIADNFTNTGSRNLKMNLFDRKLSDEMLSIKQNRYASENCKSTKCDIGTNTLQVKQKWPPLDHAPKIGEIEEIKHHVDDIDFGHVFSTENDNILPNSGSPFEVKCCNEFDKQHDQPKNKTVDLRSLSHINDIRMAVPTIRPCTCSSSAPISNWGGSHQGVYTTAGTTSHRCAGCTRTTLSVTIMPYYVPYNPPVYYPPYIYNKIEYDYGYHDDEDEKEDEYYKEEYDDKKKKKKKKEPNEKEIVVEIDYDVPRQPEVKWNAAFFEARPNKLVKDLIEDLIRLYPDSVIKKCYCPSSSNYSCTIVSPMMLLSYSLFYFTFLC